MVERDGIGRGEGAGREGKGDREGGRGLTNNQVQLILPLLLESEGYITIHQPHLSFPPPSLIGRIQWLSIYGLKNCFFNFFFLIYRG